MLCLDFETRSKIDLKKSGAWRYAEDSSTDVLCMAFKKDGEEVQLWIPAMHDLLGIESEFTFAVIQEKNFVAHNAGFERAIYENIMVKRYGFPQIPAYLWRCSAAKAAAHALPRGLADACGALALDMKKDTEGRAVMMKLARPRKPTKNDPSEWNTDPADFERLYQYCKQDIRAQIGLYNRLPDLPYQEQQVWVLDQNINVRGVKVDIETVNAAIQLIEEYNAELTQELSELTQGIVGSADERDKIMQWCALNGLELDNLQKGNVVDILAVDLPSHVKQPEKVRRALQIRQQLAKTSTAKYFAIREAICQDGCLRDLLMYHGASTGRWAGKGPQPQNLPRNTGIKDIETAVNLVRQRNLEAFRLCYEDPMDALSMLLRAMFIAREGKTMIGGDYAAIEVRVLFWLAGETKGLEMFRKGEDLYVDLAKKIYKVHTATKAQRELGKRGILGCGYGMGAKKFVITCKTHANIEIDDDFSEMVIDVYRTTYRSVVEFWYGLENAAMEAVRKGIVTSTGQIKWKVANGFLYARLPSGRCLAYCHPKIETVETPWGAKKEALTFMAVNPKTKNWERQSTYGGALAENITQAVARDLMAEAMVEAESRGFDVLLTVHDELITETVYNPGNQWRPNSEEEFKSIMETLPEWAEGLPVKVEVWHGPRYAK